MPVSGARPRPSWHNTAPKRSAWGDGPIANVYWWSIRAIHVTRPAILKPWSVVPGYIRSLNLVQHNCTISGYELSAQRITQMYRCWFHLLYRISQVPARRAPSGAFFRCSRSFAAAHTTNVWVPLSGPRLTWLAVETGID